MGYSLAPPSEQKGYTGRLSMNDNKRESIRLIRSEVPDRVVRELVIGQTMGGHTLEILR